MPTTLTRREFVQTSTAASPALGTTSPSFGQAWAGGSGSTSDNGDSVTPLALIVTIVSDLPLREGDVRVSGRGGDAKAVMVRVYSGWTTEVAKDGVTRAKRMLTSLGRDATVADTRTVVCQVDEPVATAGHLRQPRAGESDGTMRPSVRRSSSSGRRQIACAGSDSHRCCPSCSRRWSVTVMSASTRPSACVNGRSTGSYQDDAGGSTAHSCAHVCGWARTGAGSFASTLVLTDIASGWSRATRRRQHDVTPLCTVKVGVLAQE